MTAADTLLQKGFLSMSRPSFHRLKPALMASVVGLSLYAAPAAAQSRVDGEKILDLLVAKGVIERAEADAIVAEAAATPAPPPARSAAADPGVQRIPYVPEPVRKQIKEELRNEVMQQARAEGWAAPGETAEWTQRIKLSGDLRVRGEAVMFQEPVYNDAGLQTNGNFPLFPDFQAINSGSGFAVNGFDNAPFLNTSEDRNRARNRARIRARLGVAAKIDDWISAELRIATGNDTSPVSTNQTLGSGDDFGKYQLWLDRASIRLTPLAGLSIDIGRSANPFWSTDLLFDDDLNFDGVSLTGRGSLGGGLSAFATTGVFPTYNTDFNFGTTDTVKTASRNKYLIASQIGLEYKASEELGFTLAGAYLDYQNIEGRLSSPCLAILDICDSDISRPQFVQFGNTLRPIRNILVDPNNPDFPQTQYFGLASEFRIVNAHAKVDYALTDTLGVRLEGDFVHNLGFDADEIAARGPVNNLGPSMLVPDPNDPDEDIAIAGPFVGGATGWYANLIVGAPTVTKTGEWNLSVGYKYLESDAVVDAFTDSDFHLGGTNAEGFIAGGRYGIARNTQLGARWFSANEISGPPFAVDIVQIDLTTAF
jgi:hypothetical protein